MATEDRRQTPSLKDGVIDGVRRFTYVQALRLLKHHLRLVGQEPTRETLQVRPDLSLAFPATDMVSIEEREGPEGELRFLLTVTFLGLYGTSSPLPTFYTEELFQEAREDMSVTRDFLDIINSSLYPLFFQCCSKYRWGIRVVEEQDEAALGRLYCLMGLGTGEIRKAVDNPYGLLPYIGLLTQRPASAKGLEILLTQALGQPPLRVISCVAREVRIPEEQRCRLGVCGHGLGVNSYLGQSLSDRMGSFRIRVGPLDGPTFQDWLPQGEKFQRLKALIHLYLDQPLEWDLELLLGQGEVRTMRLGQEQGFRLGWNTWLFADEGRAGEVKVAFSPLSRAEI